MNGKSAAYAAAGAFILSFLIGLVSGVSLGALLFRALVMAAVFGAGTAGAQVLVHQFLPELQEPWQAGDGEAGDEGAQGIDIVLGEDDEENAGGGAAADSGGAAHRAGDAGDGAEGPGVDPGGRETRLKEDEDGNFFGEYAGAPSRAGTTKGEDSGADGGTTDDGAADLEDLAAAESGVSGGKENGRPGGNGLGDLEDLETLPAMDGAPSGGGVAGDGDDDGYDSDDRDDSDDSDEISSFGDLEGSAGMGEEPDTSDGDEGAKLVEVNGQEQDPKEMARAIQTVLKKQDG